MKIVLSQINTTVGDIRGNTELILSKIALAEKNKADLIVFPELAIPGYFPGDLLLLDHFIDDASSALDTLIKSSKNLSIIVGTVRKNESIYEKRLFNSAAVISHGQLLGFQDKSLLPTYDVFEERRFFEPGNKQFLWHIDHLKFGVTICEDIWLQGDTLKQGRYRYDPVSELAKLSPDLMINISASPYSFHKFEKRIECAKRASKVAKCPFLLCNNVGANDSLIFDGKSFCLDLKGNIQRSAKGFLEEDLWVDTEDVKADVATPLDLFEDLYQALVLGISDYFRKSGFKKACLGLSGGIDSALVACLAKEALGKENVLGVLMPSRYSSSGSLEDAERLAKALDIKTHTISIEEPFKSYLTLLSPIFKDCAPNKNDLTEQNIQARIRGMILMAIANKMQMIVLSTGNKSEYAMGYATLYGDMCGGIAPIADLTKTKVYQLANWINRNEEIIPRNTISKFPSAELAPNQKDSDSLPDYAILDNIIKAYIEEYQTPQAITKAFGYTKEFVDDVIRRIHLNEFKRKQAPLGLRVSEKAFFAGRKIPVVKKHF